MWKQIYFDCQNIFKMNYPPPRAGLIWGGCMSLSFIFLLETFQNYIFFSIFLGIILKKLVIKRRFNIFISTTNVPTSTQFQTKHPWKSHIFMFVEIKGHIIFKGSDNHENTWILISMTSKYAFLRNHLAIIFFYFWGKGDSSL